MSSNASLRDRVLEAIRTGRLPGRLPERTWAGPGCGAPCVICDSKVSADELEYELEFDLNQTRCRAIDRVRFETRQKRLLPDTEEWRLWTAPRDSEDAMARRQDADRLRTALTVLTPDEHQAIETAYFSGLTYVEAAERLNEPVGTIKTRIRSGLAKLREA